jgi:Tfp pilus assembly protein PilF
MRRRRWILICVMMLTWTGCAGAIKETRTLRAPTGTTPAAAAALEEGNRLFAARQWDGAQAQYEAAIKAQPTLAEAHYNLALVLETLDQFGAARKHYVEAANLAPGHQIIWNSPPLRKHGIVDDHGKTPTVTPGNSSLR